MRERISREWINFVRAPSRAALAQAKRRAEENYFIIGILEQLDDFYYFLDKALPKFFRGIYSNYVEQSMYAITWPATVWLHECTECLYRVFKRWPEKFISTRRRTSRRPTTSCAITWSNCSISSTTSITSSSSSLQNASSTSTPSSNAERDNDPESWYDLQVKPKTLHFY